MRCRPGIRTTYLRRIAAAVDRTHLGTPGEGRPNSVLAGGQATAPAVRSSATSASE